MYVYIYIYIYIYPLQFYYISFYDGKTKTGASLKHLLLFQSHQISSVQFSSVAQSCLTLCNPMNCSAPGLLVHHQLKRMFIESVIPSSHLILCHPLLPLPPIPPSIRVFSNESTLHMRWPKYWSFSFNISPSNEQPGLILSGWTGWTSLQSKGLSRVFSNTTVQKHQFFGT